MDILFKYMDFYYNSISALPRAFQSLFRVRDLYYHPRKTQFARMRFDTFNVSFIFSGTGRYTLGTHSCQVKAPFVITQWPGPLHEYGADDWWEEFSFTCTPAALETLKATGLVTPKKPFWPMHNHAFIRQQSERIHDLMQSGHQYGAADEIDRLCEFILFKSLSTPDEKTPSDPRQKTVYKIRHLLSSTLHQPANLKQICQDHGISPVTLHRYWKKHIGGSPGEFHNQLRLQEAARLLVRTGLSMGEIAAKTGFEDSLYFSRRFKQAFGITARDFRKQHSSKS